MNTQADLPKLVQRVISVVEAAGRQLVAEFSRPDGPRHNRAHDATVDEEIEVELRRQILNLLPARWRGEETGADSGPGGPYCWLVDPHSGTNKFLAGERGSAVAIALLRDGVPVLGVVHAPMSPDRGVDTIAWAEGLDHPLRNGASVAVALDDAGLTAGSLVFVSAAAAKWPIGNARTFAPGRFVPLTSIAYRLARVAAGDGIAAVSLNHPRGRDYAAGHALIRGAGGVLVDEAGREVTYTVDGVSNTEFCFGGAPRAVLDLTQRDWNQLRVGTPLPPRTVLTWPRIAAGDALDRAVGCLLGQVIGDSLGSLVEFRSADDIARQYPDGVRDLADGGTWNTIAGQPTDDSELALDLARTLVKQRTWSSEAVAAAYGNWYGSRPFDIGHTTAQALSRASLARFGKAEVAQNAAIRTSQANGALMRCAPIGIWARNPKEAAAGAREDAKLTHPHLTCQAASAAFVAAIACAIGGGDRDAMLAEAEAALARTEADEVLLCLGAALLGRGPSKLTENQGWVLIAFQNAFRHLAAGSSIEDALIDTVGAGGDTDTNAAICGALLGAAEGRAVIPARWSTAVLACRPLEESGAYRPRPDRYWPDDVPLLAEALLRRREAPSAQPDP
jgi:ADP-ribosylglycohydrolase/fructose-1,6-bisphosphatase/inositol monophosphatase family enzyme